MYQALQVVGLEEAEHVVAIHFAQHKICREWEQDNLCKIANMNVTNVQTQIRKQNACYISNSSKM